MIIIALLRNYRESLFHLICYHCLIYDSTGTKKCNSYEDQEFDLSWYYHFLEYVVNSFDLEFISYKEILKYLVDNQIELTRDEITNPYLCNLFTSDVSNSSSSHDKLDPSKVIISLLIQFVLDNKYSARSRVILRNLCQTFNRFIISENLNYQICLFDEIEEYITCFLEKEMKNITNSGLDSHKYEKKKSTTSKLIRYAQIGAVSVGAGVLVAITGGLAAPAIIGLGIYGTSVLFASSTIASTLFFSTGASLAGYRMMKRTKGITEFLFYSAAETAVPHKRFSRIIMIPGYQVDIDDDKRSFGLIPSKLTLYEHLLRYFYANDKDQMSQVCEDDMTTYENSRTNLKRLFEFLTKKYQKNPKDKRSLYDPTAIVFNFESFNENLRVVVKDSFELYLKHLENKKKESSELHHDINETNSVVEDLATCDDESLIEATENSQINDGNDDINSTDNSSSKEVPMESKVYIEEHPSKEILDSPTECIAVSISNMDNNMNSIDIHQTETNRPSNHSVASFNDSKFDQLPATIWNFNELAINKTYEPYLLVWDTSQQLRLGKHLNDMMYNIGTTITSQVLSETIFYAVSSAIMLPATVLSLTSSINSVWTMSIIQSDLVGIELANALIERSIDKKSKKASARPVTLIGYSFGARVIFSCLCELYRLKVQSLNETEDKEHNKYSEIYDNIVEDVVLLGAPIKIDSRKWKSIRHIVSGRIINGYSTKDIILSLVYR